MKRVSFYLSLAYLSFVAAFFMTSCQKDPEAPLPTIEFSNLPQAGYNYAANTSFSLNIRVFASERLRIVNVERIVEGLPITNLEGFPKRSGFQEGNTVYEEAVQIPVGSLQNGTVVRIRVTAKDRGANGGRTVERSFRFTVGQAGSGQVEGTQSVGTGSAPALAAVRTAILGDQNASEGSYLRTENGTVYTTSQVDQLSDSDARRIDITSARSTGGSVGNGVHVLISPRLRASDDDQPLFGTNFNFGTAQNNRNSGTITYFISSNLNPSTATPEDVEAIDFSSASSEYTTIQAGSSYAFVNNLGKKGVLRVEAIEPSGNNGFRYRINYVVQQ